MSIKTLWRSIVFITTILLIYLAFPILLVPSSLPAIQAMFIQEEYPANFFSKPSTIDQSVTADAQIFQLSIPSIPTFKEKVALIQILHRQGINLILQR